MEKLGILDLYKLVLRYYGRRLSLPTLAESSQEITCVLYSSFVFACSIDERYGYFSAAIIVDGGRNVTDILGRDFNMLENSEKSIIRALELIDKYCQLRLPDKYLEEYFKHC